MLRTHVALSSNGQVVHAAGGTVQSEVTVDDQPARDLHRRRRRFGLRFAAISHLVLGLAAATAGVLLGVTEAGRILALSGMLILVLSQCVGFALVLEGDRFKAFLALIVPGYVLFLLGRSGHYPLVVGLYMLGVLSLCAGTIALS
jgi:hypothetical protein